MMDHLSFGRWEAPRAAQVKTCASCGGSCGSSFADERGRPLCAPCVGEDETLTVLPDGRGLSLLLDGRVLSQGVLSLEEMEDDLFEYLLRSLPRWTASARAREIRRDYARHTGDHPFTCSLLGGAS